MLISTPALYGLDDSALIECQGTRLHPAAASAFLKMQQAAQNAGIDMKFSSGFRDFNTQCTIWNNKATGKRALLDINSKPIELSEQTPKEIIALILLWSALPGASRHHWGTDIDLYDASKISLKNLQLISQEYQQGGPCEQLYLWLCQNAADFGFYFPYQKGLSGVSPEPWHLSYFPVADKLLTEYDLNGLKQAISQSDLQLKAEVLQQLPYLVDEYVLKVAPSPNKSSKT